MKELITPEQLNKITDTLSEDRCKTMAALINELCNKYGITEKLPFQMFLANVIQESGEFSAKEENMNYKASTIVKTWPSRFKDIAAAEPYAHNPEALANKVYGGRMGNNQPGDGWAFKGGGFIGLTGREVYQKYADPKGMKAETVATLVKDSDWYALDSACWFFAVLKKFIPVALTGDFKKVVKGINGGYIGMDVREKYYKRCKEVLG